MAEPQAKPRTNSMSQASETSQTAADFIKEQLSLEAEAREALPYSFDTCTRDLGPLRQGLYSCLDCNPPPPDSSAPYVPAAVCYACSISCHGEHSLVELFNKRSFVCDCGTTRLPESNPCTLRVNAATGQKGGVVGEQPAQANNYNQNFRNKFCGCGEKYDPDEEKGTMFQCLGLGTVEDGGCGEDWWHPECVVGLSREEFLKSIQKSTKKPSSGITREISFSRTEEDVPNNTWNAEARRPSITTDIAAVLANNNRLSGITREISFSRTEEDVPNNTWNAEARRPSITTDIAAVIANSSRLNGNNAAPEAEGEAEGDDDDDDDDTPLPLGFPAEDDFEYFLCYKCVEAHPWIKKYAGNPGFLPPVYFDPSLNAVQAKVTNGESKKRKADADGDEEMTTLEVMAPPKRQKSEDPNAKLSSIPESTPASTANTGPSACKLPTLEPLPSPAATTPFSLFLTADFHNHLCRCPNCFPLLKPHPQLLEEEDVYEPPVSNDGGNAEGSVGTGSLLDRGEVAFNNMDRVQALQGAMAYASLKEGLKGFLKPFAESGQMVGADDIKAYFEKLRGDEAGIQAAAGDAKKSQGGENGDGDDEPSGDGRKEQSGY
ncbi:hypothetical protein P280DRAFT_549760 [Massarina eburnea CBS 473.64]|uniref:UBR-type domain-containing protein n=1 Tax=Massarina eburnea CBS 473.64 TaxID=1395130 RepID=A0A6A6RXR1_9PLEO|nr:hypothetical protein P280DRAFT_549760 [Massarina eburnea CBS 473.64]